MDSYRMMPSGSANVQSNNCHKPQAALAGLFSPSQKIANKREGKASDLPILSPSQLPHGKFTFAYRWAKREAWP